MWHFLKPNSLTIPPSLPRPPNRPHPFVLTRPSKPLIWIFSTAALSRSRPAASQRVSGQVTFTSLPYSTMPSESCGARSTPGTRRGRAGRGQEGRGSTPQVKVVPENARGAALGGGSFWGCPVAVQRFSGGSVSQGHKVGKVPLGHKPREKPCPKKRKLSVSQVI